MSHICYSFRTPAALVAGDSVPSVNSLQAAWSRLQVTCSHLSFTLREKRESFDSTTPLLTYALEQSVTMVHAAHKASIAATTKVADVRAWICRSFILTYNGHRAGCDSGPMKDTVEFVFG